jgi:acid phosphatase family membrane protein YuiD
MFGLLTVVGLRDGFDSSLFAVVLVLTLIVIYDAANVRRAVGEQGEVLRTLAKLAKHEGDFYRAQGHRISEVIVGSLLGIVIGWLVLQIL